MGRTTTATVQTLLVRVDVSMTTMEMDSGEAPTATESIAMTIIPASIHGLLKCAATESTKTAMA